MTWPLSHDALMYNGIYLSGRLYKLYSDPTLGNESTKKMQAYQLISCSYYKHTKKINITEQVTLIGSRSIF
jgi:hypothetical protein